MDDVVSGLQAQDITVSCLRDDMEGPDLEHALQQFRKGHTRVLVTSDVLCEGIEAVAGDRVPIIVHVDVPGERATFVQRLWTFGGGLATSLRRSVCLLSEGEAEVGRALERMLGVEFIESPEAPAALL